MIVDASTGNENNKSLSFAKYRMEYVENTLPNTPIKIDNNPISAKNIHSICNCTIDGRISELNA